MKAWTQNEEATLRSLAAAGESSLGIARKLGRPRNAVCGRARRMGVGIRSLRPKVEQPWVATAREMLAGGMTVAAVAKAIGKHDTTIRVTLDINGAKTKAMESSRRAKARERAAIDNHAPSAYVSRQSAMIEKARENEKRAIETAHCKPDPLPKAITLPTISLSEVPEAPKTYRLAPKARFSERPGVDRWRSIHQAMVRAGKVTTADLTTDWRH